MAFPILGSPHPAFFDSNGNPVASGTLSVLEPSDDTNKKYYPTADDADADTNSATGDITLDASGAVDGLFGIDDEKYKLVLKTSAAVTLWTEDDVRMPVRIPTLYGRTAQTLTDAGAVTLTESTTFIVTTTDSALTLADGVENQEKTITMKTEAGVAVLTPTNLQNGTYITFDTVGDTARLAFIDAAWQWISGTAALVGPFRGKTGGAGSNNLGLPDPTRADVFYLDFHTFDPNEWVMTFTANGADSAHAQLLNTASQGGSLALTNDNADNDSTSLQWRGQVGRAVEGAWKLNVKRQMFKCKVLLGDVDQTSMHIGLAVVDTTPGPIFDTVDDAIGFVVDDAATDGQVDFVVKKNGTTTTVNGIATLTDSTAIVLEWVYDENKVLSYYVDGVLGGTASTTNLPDDVDMAITMGVQNGEAAANSLTVHYIYMAHITP